MDLLHAVVELVARTLDKTSLFEWIVLSVLWSPFLVLAHELGHAFAASRLTRGPVAVGVGNEEEAVRFQLGRVNVAMGLLWPSLGGSCEYDSERQRGQSGGVKAMSSIAASTTSCAPTAC